MKPKVFVCLAVFGIGILTLLLICCGPKGRVAMDPTSKDFYEYARLIMTKPEKDIFLMLPDKESREEFIDKNGDGRYSLGRQVGAGGGLLEVIEKAKFGQIYDDRGDIGTVFSKFRMDYDRAAREIVIAIPIESLSFESAENKLKADFDFEFFIYARKGTENTRFKRQKTYETTEEKVLELDEIILTFPYDLKPGEYYFDVVTIVKPKIGKVRKIFKIKV